MKKLATLVALGTLIGATAFYQKNSDDDYESPKVTSDHLEYDSLECVPSVEEKGENVQYDFHHFPECSDESELYHLEDLNELLGIEYHLEDLNELLGIDYNHASIGFNNKSTLLEKALEKYESESKN